MPDPLRTTTGQNQRTLKPEGPVNGQNYLIDLSTDNARHFHNLLAPYVDAARIAPALDAQRANPSQIREWARTQGLPVAHRGKIPQDVIEAYNAAN